jgi:23S rRNA pseudouridine2605 synthase
VRVDGEVVLEPGRRVDPDRARITVHGRALPASRDLVWYALHKPAGVLTTMSDPGGRPTVSRFLPRGGPRLFPVGRLDGDTSGLLLVTNDGTLGHRLMHPRYQVEKTYVLRLAEPATPRQLVQLASGVEFAPGERSRPAEVEVRSPEEGKPVIALTIAEGRNRQVRRMCDAIGLPLVALRRERLGPIHLGDQAEGTLRRLTREEIASLRAACATAPVSHSPGRVTARKRATKRARTK